MASEPVPSSDRRRVRRVALASLTVALVLAGLKLAAAVASGSLALLSEAAHSGLDAVVTAMTLVAVSIAARPPDEDHPYGHGKAENVAALVEGIVLLGLSASIAAEALRRLSRPVGDIEAGWYGFGVILLSMAVDASRARALRRAGRELRSPALSADAVNFTADLLTSTVVLAGLGAVKLGYPGVDSLGGLAIAGYVALVSLRLGWRSIDVLMDRVPRGALARITQAVAGVAGVEEVRRVRLRYAGGQPQADVVLAVSRSVPLELAHHLTEEVEEAIRSVEPGADVAVHVEPLADEKLIVNRILSIAARHSQVHQLHNVFVARRPDGLHVSLHAKFPASMALSEAHAITDRLEAEIARDLGGVRRIDTHLEPLDGPTIPGADATAREKALVQAAASLAESQVEVQNCHEVVVTDTADGLLLVMHCEAAAGLSIRQVHAASTRIESELHRRWPALERVIIHFEPSGTIESPGERPALP